VKLVRGDLMLSVDDGGAAVLEDGGGRLALSVDALRWIVVAAGPAVLVELAQREAACR